MSRRRARYLHSRRCRLGLYAISAMSLRSRIRRRLLSWAPAMFLTGASPAETASGTRSGTLTVYTFGDSILDCGRYNELRIHPGAPVDRHRKPRTLGREYSE